MSSSTRSTRWERSGAYEAKTFAICCSSPNFHYRYDSSSGGEREIQRTLLELLNQLDGFDTRHDVKVIMATNRIESLDPALIRPGYVSCCSERLCQADVLVCRRIDRKIEFPMPDAKTKM